MRFNELIPIGKHLNMFNVSFIVVILNSAKSLPDLLQDIVAQDYPKENFEILLVDGGSTDNSLKILHAFRCSNQSLNVSILNNQGRILSTGWNVALAYAKGDVIMRVDAHSRVPEDFISKNVSTLLKGESIVGGIRISQVPQEPWPAFFALAEASRFGAGSAGFKNPGPARYVETLAHAAYKREVFACVGGYDERLVRNQDMEIHYRMKEAGFRFYFNPEICSFHFPRANMVGLLKQKFGNGYWIALTMSISPRCFCLRHLIPAVFVGAFFGSVVAVFWSVAPLLLLLGLYFFCAVFFAFKAFQEAKASVKPLCFLLPLVFFLIHIFYGLGTWVGLVSIPFFRLKYRDYVRPHPVCS